MTYKNQKMNSVQLLHHSRLLSWLLFASLHVTALSHLVARPGEGNHKLWQIRQADKLIGNCFLACPLVLGAARVNACQQRSDKAGPEAA